jgi:hypothetical protein
MKPCRVCGNYGPFSPSRIAKQNWICHPCNDARWRDNFNERMRGYRKDPALRPRFLAKDQLHINLRRGTIKRGPCEVCGSEDSEAHHDDYSKPLDVRWLCRKHHREHHQRIKEGL